MTLRVVTAPTDRLQTDVELRLHCGLQGIPDWDDLLTVYLAAATGQLEAATQRRFLTTVYDWSLPGWPACGEIRLPIAPVAADGVASITYADANGASTVLASSLYVVSPCGPTVSIRPVLGQPWPILDPDAEEPVVIRFTAGLALADQPPAVTTAAALLVAHHFRHRDAAAPADLAASQLPPSVEALIGSERWEHGF